MNYSISDLEQLSGVSVHNIRIWERRYNALQPMRSAGNTRFYDDDQLRRLLNIASLNRAGLKISNACALSKSEMDELLQKEIDQCADINNSFEYYISQIISNGLVYDETRVNLLISTCMHNYGVVETYRQVIYPLLVRLGLMWSKDSLCTSQEHFLASIIRQKLLVAIDELPAQRIPRSVWLLFLPEDEDHDIGLLLANYLLREAGQKVIYLGAKVPLNAVRNAIDGSGATRLLLFMTRIRPVDNAVTYLNQLSTVAGEVPAYVSGNSRLLSTLGPKVNVTWLHNIEAFENLIKCTADV